MGARDRIYASYLLRRSYREGAALDGLDVLRTTCAAEELGAPAVVLSRDDAQLTPPTELQTRAFELLEIRP